QAEAEYTSWVACLEHDERKLETLKDVKALPEPLRNLDGVNIDDSNAFKEYLFPLFGKHMGVVNFWLTRVVLPAEARQFKHRLTSTAWDLCRKVRSITVGFSGTDDLKALLPTTIEQRNMPKLKGTNGRQLRMLLRPENDDYVDLSGGRVAQAVFPPEEKMGTGATDEGKQTVFNTTTQILTVLSERHDISVVLDIGALILDLSSVEFCREWLSRRRDARGLVFFDKSNTIQVMLPSESRCSCRKAVQNGSTISGVLGGRLVVPFALSPFEKDMSGCLLYLDDDHTRGADFDLPTDARALATFGPGTTKDRLMQGAMRMRKLGRGQSVTIAGTREISRALEKIKTKAKINECIDLCDAASHAGATTPAEFRDMLMTPAAFDAAAAQTTPTYFAVSAYSSNDASTTPLKVEQKDITALESQMNECQEQVEKLEQAQ
ncbi:unnamed protein product, partial [Amoebophrya sp. A25]